MIVLLAIGVFLRIWNLNHVPVSLFGDEIDAGLQSYSILTTGNDYMGNPFPVMFRSFAEYRLPFLLYLNIPFIKIFGLNEWGVRIGSVLLGLISVYGMFLLSKELFGKRVAVIAALLLLYSPWHLIFARQANDPAMLMPFVLFGTLFFIKGSKEYKFLLYSAVTWGLGIYSYATLSLFMPLFVLFLFIFYFDKLKGLGIKKLAFAAFLGLLVISPYLNESFKGSTTRRISNITLISQEEREMLVSEGRMWARGIWRKAFYNKYTVVGEKLFNNYTQAFSASFLFSDGDPNPRHSVGGFGQMYQFEIITVFIGICVSVAALKRRERKNHIIFFFWLVVAPLPSILTEGGGTHAPRLILMLPPLIIFSAMGIDFLLRLKKPLLGKVFMIFFTVFIIFSVSRFMHSFFVIWPNESWRFWHYGFSQTINYVKSVDSEYQKIYFNNTYEPMLKQFLFYYKYDMNLFQKQFTGDVHIENLEEGFDGFSLGDRYFFGDLKKPIEQLAKPGYLIIASGEKDVTNPHIFENSNLKLLDVTTSPYMDKIFYVYTEN